MVHKRRKCEIYIYISLQRAKKYIYPFKLTWMGKYHVEESQPVSHLLFGKVENGNEGQKPERPWVPVVFVSCVHHVDG